MPAVKLILSYHKPDILLQDEILTPVHAGRAIARDRMAADDPKLEWLLSSTLGDDSGENISAKNPVYNEMTAVYWAWRNYAALGDPEFIGFMHYRRHFLFADAAISQLEATNLGSDDAYLSETLGYSSDVIDELLSGHDFVYPCPQHRPSMREHFDTNHHARDLDLAIEILDREFPQFSDAAREYLGGSKAYFCNMFILPKNLFFEYSEFIFGILFQLEETSDFANKRMFVSEWLTGIFITDLIRRGLKGKALPMVIAEGPHRIPVVVSASPSYAQAMSVTLTSLLENAGSNTSYDVYILHSGGYDPLVESQLDQLMDRYPGTNVEFLDLGDAFGNVEVATSHVRRPTYFRLAIPSLLPDLARCIYLDTDVVVEQDLTSLFRTVVDDKYLAAVAGAGYRIRSDEAAAQIGLPSYDEYFNAGVLLLNLERMRREGLEARFKELATLDLESDDQDVLNIACYGQVRPLHMRFNVMTKYLPKNEDEFLAYTGVRETWTATEREEAVREPIVIHYADKRKPWLDSSVDFADRWWHYALLSPMRDQIVSDWLTRSLETGQERSLANRANLVDARRAKSAAERKLRADPTKAELKTMREAIVSAARLQRALEQEKTRRVAAQRHVEHVRNSRSFRLGRTILAPLKLLRRPYMMVKSGKPRGGEPDTSKNSDAANGSHRSDSKDRESGPGNPGNKRSADVTSLGVGPRSPSRRPWSRRAVDENITHRSLSDLRSSCDEQQSELKLVSQAIADVAASVRVQSAQIVSVNESVTATTDQLMAGLDALSTKQSLAVEGVKAIDDRFDWLQGRSTATLKAANEAVWAEVFHDTIKNSSWFKDQALSPGRWAVGYPFLYVLHRILDEMKPRSILEMGLGQSTKMVAQYVAATAGTRHQIAEHDTRWAGFVQLNAPIPPSSTVVPLELTVETRPDGKTALRYDKFHATFGSNEYDLVIVDGPFGDASQDFSRVDILDLVPNSLSSRFAVLVDDYERLGESRTVEELRQAMTSAGVTLEEATYAGSKTMWLGVSADLSFFTTL